MATEKFITLSNLTKYDELIKQYIGTEDAKSYKVVEYDSTTRVISFYKKADKSDTPVTVTLPSDVNISGKADKAVPATVNNIAVLDATGNLVDGGATVASLATAADLGTVSTLTTDAKTAVGAINELDAAVDTLKGADTVAGSVAKSIKDAVEALDADITSSSTANAKGDKIDVEVKEVDGKITEVIVTGNYDATYDAIGAAAAVQGNTTATVKDVKDVTDALGTASKSNVATVAIGTTGEATDALPTVAQVKSYLTGQIADLEGAMHFVGVITRQTGETDAQAIARVVSTPKPGDVVVMSDNAKEYIFVDPDPETAGDEVWREVGDEGLYVQKSTTIAGVDLQDNVTKAELLTALNVADGAQVNVLEGVQVNGTDLATTNKKVNVTVATGSANGNIAVNGVDVAVKGLDTAAYEKVATTAIALGSTDTGLTTSAQVATFVDGNAKDATYKAASGSDPKVTIAQAIAALEASSSDTNGALVFKGTKTAAELAALTGVKTGDAYLVSDINTLKVYNGTSFVAVAVNDAFTIGDADPVAVGVKAYIDSRIFVGTAAEIAAAKTAKTIDSSTFVVEIDENAEGIGTADDSDIAALFATT